jgi:hypothetical protein
VREVIATDRHRARRRVLTIDDDVDRRAQERGGGMEPTGA